MDGIWGLTTAYEIPQKNVLLLLLRLAIEEVTKEKNSKVLVQKIPGKTKNSKFFNCFILVSDLDSGSVTVSDLDNNTI